MTTRNQYLNYDFDPDEVEILYNGDTPEDISTINAMGTEGWWTLVGRSYHTVTHPYHLKCALVSERGMVRLAMEMFNMCMVEARQVEPEWRYDESGEEELFMFYKDGEWFAVPDMPCEVEELCTCPPGAKATQKDVDVCPMKAWWVAERKAKKLVNNHFGKEYIR